MAAELGIGVRVWVGWVPPERTDGSRSLQAGVIIDGPVRVDPAWGVQKVFWRRGTVRRAATFWCVRLSDGCEAGVDQRYISPIDDDNDQTTRDERELVEERA